MIGRKIVAYCFSFIGLLLLTVTCSFAHSGHDHHENGKSAMTIMDVHELDFVAIPTSEDISDKQLSVKNSLKNPMVNRKAIAINEPGGGLCTWCLCDGWDHYYLKICGSGGSCYTHSTLPCNL